MKAKYELTLVLPANNEKLTTEIKKLVKDFVTKSKGKIVKEESWGIKELAYPIQKQTQGLYEFYLLELDTQAQPKLHRLLNLQEGLLRYLFVRV